MSFLSRVSSCFRSCCSDSTENAAPDLTSVGLFHAPPINPQINYLNERLNATARKCFTHFLKPPAIGDVAKHSTLVVGDLDGSAGRMILAAMQSGHMKLNGDAQLKALVKILNAEANLLNALNHPNMVTEEAVRRHSNANNENASDTREDREDDLRTEAPNSANRAAFAAGVGIPYLKKPFDEEDNPTNNDDSRVETRTSTSEDINNFRKLTEFQNSQTIRQLIENIANNATYSKGSKPLIFIGDCCFDRLTCNIEFEMQIREKLKEQGCIFILGNHDDVEAAKVISSEQAGRQAYDYYLQKHFNGDQKTCEEKLNEHQKNVFQRCHYDAKNNLFYIHNGIETPNVIGTSIIRTAFGNFTIEGITDTEIIDIRPDDWTVEKFMLKFAETLNSREKKDLVYPTAFSYEERLTSFRVESHSRMNLFKFLENNCIKQKDIRPTLTVVHGHDGIFKIDSDNNSVSINARIPYEDNALTADKNDAPNVPEYKQKAPSKYNPILTDIGPVSSRVQKSSENSPSTVYYSPSDMSPRHPPTPPRAYSLIS